MAYSHHPAFSPFSNCRPDLFGPPQLQTTRHNVIEESSPATGQSKRHSWQKLAKAFSLSKSKDKINHETGLQTQSGPDNQTNGLVHPEPDINNSWKATAAPSIQLQADSVTNLPWEQQNEFTDDAHVYDGASFQQVSAESDYSLYPPPDRLVRQLSNRLRNSLQLTTTGTNTSCDYLSPVVSETASINNQPGTCSPITKRSRRRDTDEYRSDDDDDDRHIKRSRQHSPDPNYNPPQECILFACPFSKFNPDKYSHKNTKESDRECRNCSTGYWPTIARLKQHIYRTHDRTEKCCQQCWQSFTNESLLKKHVAAATCEVQPCPAGSITAEQRQAIKERAQCDPIIQWYKIWDILFPNHPRPHSVTPEWVTGRDVLRVFQTIRERLPVLLSATSDLTKQYVEHVIDLICDDFSSANNFTEFLSSSYVIEALGESPTHFTHNPRQMPGTFHTQPEVSIEDHSSYQTYVQQSIPDSAYSTSAGVQASLDHTSIFSDHIRPADMFGAHHPVTISPHPQHIISEAEFVSYPFPNFEMSQHSSQVYAGRPQH